MVNTIGIRPERNNDGAQHQITCMTYLKTSIPVYQEVPARQELPRSYISSPGVLYHEPLSGY